MPALAQERMTAPLRSKLPTAEVKAKVGPTVAPGAVSRLTTGFQAAEGFTDGRSTWLRWRMTAEVNNFGFNVYSIDPAGKHRLNDDPVLGGAARIANRPVYGQDYQFLATSGSQFVIETISLVGPNIVSNAIVPAKVRDLGTVDGFSKTVLTKPAKAAGRLQSVALQPDADLQAEINQALLDPDPSAQVWIASQPGVKIGVRPNHNEWINSTSTPVRGGQGIYRVTRAQLSAAGFDVNSDPATWQLYLNGNEQAITVEPSGAYIEFFGRPIDTIESETQIYYLIAGPTAGKRIVVKPAGPNMSTVLGRSYTQTFVNKERTLYLSSLLNGPAENYFGSVITTSPHNFNFDLSGVDTNGSCSMTIKMQGFSFTDHTLAITLNGHALDPMVGELRDPYSATYTFPASFLNEGANTLTTTSTGVAADISLFDQFSLTFQRRYVAQQNSLSFYTQPYRAAQLTGFTSPNVRLFDVTYDGQPVQLTGSIFENSGGTFGTRVPANRARVMFAVEDSAVLSPFSIERNDPSSIMTSNHNADLLIITYKDWMTQANAWADYRRGQGFQVEVVDVADIFDEFNYGVLNSDSLKRFLLYAKHNWQTPPRYVLILGDATYDPRNYELFAERAGTRDYVPVDIVTTLFTETGSDDALVDFNNDGLAEMAIGRIPARDGQTVTNALNKVINFEQPANQTLSRGALFAYDVDPSYDFGAMSTRLRDELPVGTPNTMVGKTDPNAEQNLVTAMNTGPYVVNYSGHGTVGLWSADTFFGGKNIVCTEPAVHPCISNAGHESIFIALTCLNGYFLQATADSLSENLLKTTNGGAVAVLASTGETTPDVQEVMGQRFYSQLGTSTTITRMGDFMIDAKSVVIGGPDVRLSFALIGDPMLKIKQ